MSEIETNKYGGKQSRLNRRYDLIPPIALEVAAAALHHGAVKYGENNWKQITTNEHVNHALNHLFEFLKGADESEDHLAHALVRIMFAYHVDFNGVVTNNAPKPLNEDANSYEQIFYEIFEGI